MDVLHRLFQKASSDGVLKRMRPSGIKFQSSFYTDDVIMFIWPTVQEAAAVKHTSPSLGKHLDFTQTSLNAQSLQYTAVKKH
jgi:hypothetical protein